MTTSAIRIGLVVLATLAVGGAKSVGQGRPATPVVVESVQAVTLPATIRLVGTVVARREATIASESAGLVVAFIPEEGAFVKAGELICKLDKTLASLALDAAQARLASLRAMLDELSNGTRVEVTDERRAAVLESDAMARMWTLEVERLDELFERNLANAKERNDASQELVAAQGRLAQRQAALRAAENGARDEVRARASHDVVAQEAVVRSLEHALSRMEIVAPFDGFIVAKRCELGEWLTVGGAVCEFVDIEVVRIRADVPERAIRFAQSGAPASVELVATGQTLTGSIARVIPRADASARTFRVEIDVDNAEHTLLPGMFAWAHVPSGPDSERTMVNKDAIVAKGQSKTIYVIRQAGPDAPAMAMPLAVTTGLEFENRIDVQHPQLRAGDQVVIRGNERLRGPTRVVPKTRDDDATTARD